MRGETGELRGEIRGEMSELRAELKGEMAEIRANLAGGMAVIRGEFHRWAAGILAGNAIAVITALTV